MRNHISSGGGRVVARVMMAFSAACGMAFFALPVQAQLSAGSSCFSSAPTSASEAEYWTMVRRLGLCLADSKRDKSIAFLDTVPGSKEEGGAFRELFHRNSNRCMGNFISAQIVRGHIRGSVAEGFVTMMDGDAKQARLATPVVAPENIRSIGDFAQCYLAGNPATALEFLEQTNVGTAGEIDALRQMSSKFGVCLPEGFKSELDPVNVRMAIAEAVYHAVDPRRKTASERQPDA